MNVLVVTANADAPFLTQQVDALEARGVAVRILPIAGEVGADVDRSPLDYVRTVPRVLREAGPEYDLVHAHYGLTAPAALAQLRLPVVLSLWGSDVYGPAAPVSKLCAPLCAETVVMSDAMRTELGRGTVIPDGVDLERFRPESRARAREDVGWSADEYHVLFPYSPARTVKNYPRAERVVAAASRRLDRPVRLQTVSGVDHDAVSTYLNAADALLLTSDSEGSPNSVKEALACNVPVVSVPVGDVPERLGGVDPSVVARTDRALVAGLVDVLERGERSNGREAAREVSIERTADRMLAVYERATGTRVADREREREAVASR
ncbi:glycosyltransferase [Natronococcus occultus]|uniref:Glycosyltransferase n=1 Tax=Natronococcus occultus SP4 TaxID=694430 RepID=L0K1C4_9EURY|nr:glycosyltransferase [Natronococcus occultus]AGB39112.1 glycosyltransferase [Natronococcus occultus SP4]